VIRKQDAWTITPRTPGQDRDPAQADPDGADLSLLHSGRRRACLEIKRNPGRLHLYDEGNLVAVVSNGTAVLGLGNIGPSAAKP
jgi:malate dehydrogenase (oxaloacetate-decarboxylating)(NADP+)